MKIMKQSTGKLLLGKTIIYFHSKYYVSEIEPVKVIDIFFTKINKIIRIIPYL